MNIGNFREEITSEKERIFSDARLVILEELPFYLKMRIILDEQTFVEVRRNSGSRRESMVLVRDNKRIAGFDNLGGWHIHPCGLADTHRKIIKPSTRFIFEHLAECYRK
ncbi:MAG: hypothetical protein HYT98_02840 [Candidatus Sungbacteria bacterium]|nr:hypothetical protein [Candidatus Sungbacteria bacterium]